MMKKMILNILVFAVCALWLFVIFLMPPYRLTTYGLSYFENYAAGTYPKFFGFLLSPFVALLISGLVTLVTGALALGGKNQLLPAIIANSYLYIQIAIHRGQIPPYITAGGGDVPMNLVYLVSLIPLIAGFAALFALSCRLEENTEEKVKTVAATRVNKNFFQDDGDETQRLNPEIPKLEAGTMRKERIKTKLNQKDQKSDEKILL